MLKNVHTVVMIKILVLFVLIAVMLVDLLVMTAVEQLSAQRKVVVQAHIGLGISVCGPADGL